MKDWLQFGVELELRLSNFSSSLLYLLFELFVSVSRCLTRQQQMTRNQRISCSDPYCVTLSALSHAPSSHEQLLIVIPFTCP